MSIKVGKNCKIALGANTVIEMGNWAIATSADLYDSSEIEDKYKSFVMGQRDSGQISISGIYDPDNSTGQEVLRNYCDNGNRITNLRLYIDGTYYWTTTASSPTSYVQLVNWSVTADKNNVLICTFVGKVSGKFTLTS